MVACVQLADVGVPATLRLLRRPPAPSEAPGLRYSEMLTSGPLNPRVVRRPPLRRVGLITAWDDDAALDGFLAGHPLAGALAGGYRVRLRPTRIIGSWAPLGDIANQLEPDDDGPPAVLTLGRVRPRRAVAFLRTAARAERDALASPGLVMASALARPPGTVATFSVWRSVEPMRDYVQNTGGGHRAAMHQHSRRSFHFESAFIRFRSYDESGRWPPAPTST